MRGLCVCGVQPPQPNPCTHTTHTTHETTTKQNTAMPGMVSGDILGHEYMGVVEDVGADVKRLAK